MRDGARMHSGAGRRRRCNETRGGRGEAWGGAVRRRPRPQHARTTRCRGRPPPLPPSPSPPPPILRPALLGRGKEVGRGEARRAGAGHALDDAPRRGGRDQRGHRQVRDARARDGAGQLALGAKRERDADRPGAERHHAVPVGQRLVGEPARAQDRVGHARPLQRQFAPLLPGEDAAGKGQARERVVGARRRDQHEAPHARVARGGRHVGHAVGFLKRGGGWAWAACTWLHQTPAHTLAARLSHHPKRLQRVEHRRRRPHPRRPHDRVAPRQRGGERGGLGEGGGRDEGDLGGEHRARVARPRQHRRRHPLLHQPPRHHAPGAAGAADEEDAQAGVQDGRRGERAALDHLAVGRRLLARARGARGGAAGGGGSGARGAEGGRSHRGESAPWPRGSLSRGHPALLSLAPLTRASARPRSRRPSTPPPAPRPPGRPRPRPRTRTPPRPRPRARFRSRPHPPAPRCCSSRRTRR